MGDDGDWLDEVTPFPGGNLHAEIERLAKLSEGAYQQQRRSAAKRLKVQVGFLDQEVKRVRSKTRTDGGDGDPFEVVPPWPDQVDAAELLSELESTIKRFCILPQHSAPVMAAWVLHAWAHDAADHSPLLAFISPEKRCGKTTALTVIAALVPRPLLAANLTTSVVFRVVEKYSPCILVDEADTFLAVADDFRGILNAGHSRQNPYVWRCIGDDHEPRAFKVWAPKVIAMIGRLPDTLEDRALVVALRRKRRNETVERFRPKCVDEFLPLRRRAARWAKDNLSRLRDMDPPVPLELDDRSQDNARPLCAIVDVVGGGWPQSSGKPGWGSAATRTTNRNLPVLSC